jgi:hypothetical protein
MISHAEFGKLRLAHFRSESDIAELADWEFMGRIWLGEAIGFSEWLRLEDDPCVLRSIAIDFREFPAPDAAKVLDAIGSEIRCGMTFDELRSLLGQPISEYRKVKDRVTYEFVTSAEPYNVSCTVLNEGGLTYLQMMVSP